MGLDLVASLLEMIPKDAPVVLDPNDVGMMRERREAMGAACIDRVAAFTELRERWSAERACHVMRAEWPDLLRGKLAVDGLRVRRAVRAPTDRAALFALGFGYARGSLASKITEWLEAAPRPEPSRSVDEDARALLNALLIRNVIQLADTDLASVIGILRIAVQHRSASGLEIALDALLAQGLVELASTSPSSWRKFIRVVGVSRGNVPVFDRELLASIVETLGD